MSSAQTHLDTWTTPDPTDNTRTRPSVDWDQLTPAVRRVTTFEALTGTTTVTMPQADQTPRLVDDTINQDVARATEDGHDYSDMGGGDHE